MGQGNEGIQWLKNTTWYPRARDLVEILDVSRSQANNQAGLTPHSSCVDLAQPYDVKSKNMPIYIPKDLVNQSHQYSPKLPEYTLSSPQYTLQSPPK